MNDEGVFVTTELQCEPDSFPETFDKIIGFFDPDFSSINF
jgi:hypothetical protein